MKLNRLFIYLSLLSSLYAYAEQPTWDVCKKLPPVTTVAFINGIKTSEEDTKHYMRTLQRRHGYSLENNEQLTPLIMATLPNTAF